MKKLLALLVFIGIYWFIGSYSVYADWPMTAANPQRTSWVPDEIRGDLKPVWYKALTPYIDNKVQAIAANNAIYVATSKGLYAFDANNGTQLWVYGTELPLGNSPTYDNGVLYVGGFDHKIHAIDAASGLKKAGWTFVEAGAGYDTNPLVVNNTVYAGNRDGNFYALSASDGHKLWQFPTGGPIHYSAAYKNGVVYFASDDSFAYALDASSGQQIWKSGPFPGVGFDMYWPVIYTDSYTNPSSPTDYVIFSGSFKGSTGWFCNWGYWASSPNDCNEHTPNFEMYNKFASLAVNGNCGPSGVEPYLWTPGTPTIRCDVIDTYYNNNPKWNGQPPYWRISFILNRSTGSEFKPYAPFNPSGIDGNGQGYKHPPVVDGKNILYEYVGYHSGGNGGAGGFLTGWKFGSPYISLIYNDRGASDEPNTFTAGGNLLYWAEGMNHTGFKTIDTSIVLNTSSDPSNTQVGTWNPLQLPGVGANFSNFGSTSLTSKFGGVNGVYSNFDGVLNMSPIPYNGKIYLITANTLFAMSPTGAANSPQTIAAMPANTSASGLSLTQSDVQQRLINEVQKMLDAGHLRPGFHDTGGFGKSTNAYYEFEQIAGEHIAEYFTNPADTLTTLALALPHLPASMSTQVKAYMQSEEQNYKIENIADIGWKNGASREGYPDPPEMAAVMNNPFDDGNSAVASIPRTNLPGPSSCCAVYTYIGSFPAESFYGAWKYAQIFGQSEALRLYNAMSGKLPSATSVAVVGPATNHPTADSLLIKYPYVLNQYLAGYYGFIHLAQLAGISSSDPKVVSVTSEYNRLLNLRVANFDENTPWTNETQIGGGDSEYNNALNVARNFMFLQPEIAEALSQSAKAPQILQALADYQTLTPYWFVSKYDRSFSETYSQPLYDYPALFQARAYIQKLPFTELVKYLDVPAFQRGDLFYIQNLVAALSVTSAVPTPTPESLVGDGDADVNGVVDVNDLKIIISNWFAHLTTAVDQYKDGFINALDFAVVYSHLQPVTGQTYYVALTGADTNPGTLASPWRHIQKAATAAVAGDTVYIRAGTYNEQVTVQNSGTPGSYITFAAYSGETPIIDGTSGVAWTQESALFQILGKSYIKVVGLKIQNAGIGQPTPPAMKWIFGILAENSTGIILQNNSIYNTFSSGIMFMKNNQNFIIDGNEVDHPNWGDGNAGEGALAAANNNSGFEIKNNKVHDGYGGPREGIHAYYGTSNGTIHNNEVYKMGVGFYLDSWDQIQSNIQIFNNYSHNNSTGGFALASENGGTLSNISLYNNISTKNPYYGIVVTNWDNAINPNHFINGVQIVNNTVYGNSSEGVANINPQATGIVIRNNIVSANTGANGQIYIANGASATVDHNLIISDPKLVNPTAATPDYHLQSLSPAIDNGSATNAPATDFDGNSRPFGAGFDIGAYEYGGVIGPSATPTSAPLPTPTSVVSATPTSIPVSGSYCISGDISFCSPPTGEWRFNEGSGTVVADSSGSGLNASWIGSTSSIHWTTGKYGNGGNFDGGNDYAAASAGSGTYNTFTFEFWVKLADTSGPRGLASWADSPAAGNPFLLVNIGGAAANKLSFFTDTAGYVESSASLSPNTWYHVAVTKDANSSWSFYLNGQLLSSHTLLTSRSVPTLYFGTGYNGVANGVIDEVRLFNYARTSQQIQQVDMNYVGL